MMDKGAPLCVIVTESNSDDDDDQGDDDQHENEDHITFNTFTANVPNLSYCAYTFIVRGPGCLRSLIDRLIDSPPIHSPIAPLKTAHA